MPVTVRTPLAALSRLHRHAAGPARAITQARERFLSIMHAQATRMARLIDDLLSLSRVELSAMSARASVDIVPIVRQVADGLEPWRASAGVIEDRRRIRR